ncbi:MAG: hypothetical protein ACLQIB_32745 [Isosphaeraceae bacterium]
MRQVLDLLVWLVVFMVVGAVIYLAPRFAHSVAAMGSRDGQGCNACREIAALNPDNADASP